MIGVSIVVPTFNRGEKLSATLDCLLASNCEGLRETEIVVVDDGSDVSAAPVLTSRVVRPPFTLSCVRQENGGPAAARNKGCELSHNDVIIFIDDDILVPPDLILKHVRAHQLYPGSVVFGTCTLPNSRMYLAKFLKSLAGYGSESGKPKSNGRTQEFYAASLVASGHISVEKRMLSGGTFYESNLVTPAAEEFELSARLTGAGIPILQANGIEALHWIDISIEAICRQQYKHGMGCAEAACKYPKCVQLPQLRHILETSGYLESRHASGAWWKRVLRVFITRAVVCKALLYSSQMVEKLLPSYWVNAKMYQLTVTAFFLAGIKDGMDRFGSRERGGSLENQAQEARVTGADKA